MPSEAMVERREHIIGRSSKVGYANGAMKRKRCKRKIIKYEFTAPSPLQDLYEASREVFKGPGTVPSPQDVKRLCHMLDNMKPEAVGLSSKLQFFSPKMAVGNPRVTYTTICKCDNFSMCIFFLPANAVIPLHNHPGMTVFSKLLLGTMHIKSYDWVDPPSTDDNSQPSKLKLAKLVADRDFTSPCDSSVLYPTTGGNMHQFTAITPCAILDVLGPPYSKEDGRDCSYYKDFPYSAYLNGDDRLTEEEGVSYGWLEETELPADSQMDGIEYLGPQIVESIVAADRF
uniref:cysteine dioxygenase n=1 Tax=Rhizophora mucronata TaxID=61149 RepID=A0A2P2IS09_RHIMU